MTGFVNRVFIKGDCHGDFMWLKDFCKKENTTKDDLVIICGDAGINFWLNKTDAKKKNFIDHFPITLLCVQGNHEKRPNFDMGYIPVYKEEIEGKIWIEPKHPTIWFAINGTYKIKNKTFLIADGAYSIDKFYRQSRNIPWFEDEQMSDKDMNKLFHICKKEQYFDFVISHTAPMNYEPRYLFLDFVDQTMVDKHTEWILQEIVNKIQFGHWIFGHYHADNWEYRTKPRFSIIYKEIKQII